MGNENKKIHGCLKNLRIPNGLQGLRTAISRDTNLTKNDSFPKSVQFLRRDSVKRRHGEEILLLLRCRRSHPEVSSILNAAKSRPNSILTNQRSQKKPPL